MILVLILISDLYSYELKIQILHPRLGAGRMNMAMSLSVVWSAGRSVVAVGGGVGVTAAGFLNP